MFVDALALDHHCALEHLSARRFPYSEKIVDVELCSGTKFVQESDGIFINLLHHDLHVVFLRKIGHELAWSARAYLSKVSKRDRFLVICWS